MKVLINYMLTQQQFARIKHSLPLLNQAGDPLLRDFKNHAYYATIPAGKDVFIEGDEANSIALLITGVVRVYKMGETGREITIYRFGHGESCILTANAILSCKSFPAIATVEENAEAVMIPAEVFRDWVKRYDLWRDFVFNLLSDRLTLVLAVVDEVVFQRIDRRVAALVLNKAQDSKILRITHNEIAIELGSSREVISRILEDLARQGLLMPGRGTLEILDDQRLKSLSTM